MYYFKYKEHEDCFLVLEPEDWTEGEWKIILKLFGMIEAERIVLRDYTLEAYGTPTPLFKVLIDKQERENLK